MSIGGEMPKIRVRNLQCAVPVNAAALEKFAGQSATSLPWPAPDEEKRS